MRVRGCFGHYTTEDKPFVSGSAAELFRCTSGGYIYKKYKTPLCDPAAIAQLHRVLDLGRQIVVDGSQQAGSTPETSVNWPIDIVEDISMGIVSGVIIPEAPHRFYRSTDKLRTLDWLILARTNPPGAATRLAVLIRLAEIFAFLDNKGLVHGDLSVNNVLWSDTPQPGAYLIDCDGLQAHSAPSPHGLVKRVEWLTPDWIDPRRIEGVIDAHDHYSDCYALALAMYRGLFLNPGILSKDPKTKTWPKPVAFPQGLAPQIKEFLERSLGYPLNAHARPSPREWVTALVATFVTNNSYDTRKLKVLEDHAQKYRHEHQRLSKGFPSLPTQSRWVGFRLRTLAIASFIREHKIALAATVVIGGLIILNQDEDKGSYAAPRSTISSPRYKTYAPINCGYNFQYPAFVSLNYQTYDCLVQLTFNTASNTTTPTVFPNGLWMEFRTEHNLENESLSDYLHKSHLGIGEWERITVNKLSGYVGRVTNSGYQRYLFPLKHNRSFLRIDIAQGSGSQLVNEIIGSLQILNQYGGDVASDFVGKWSGNVTQTGQPIESSRLPAALRPTIIIDQWTINPQSTSVNTEYPVVITIHPGQLTESVGTIDYATLGCAGDLILAAASSTQISIEESLTRGFSTCTNHTIITLALNADETLLYNVQASSVFGSAVLKNAD